MPRITPIPDDATGDHEPLCSKNREKDGARCPASTGLWATRPKRLRHIMNLTVALRSQWRAEPGRMRLMQLAILTPSLIKRLRDMNEPQR